MAEHRPGARRVSRRPAASKRSGLLHLGLVAPADGMGHPSAASCATHHHDDIDFDDEYGRHHHHHRSIDVDEQHRRTIHSTTDDCRTCNDSGPFLDNLGAALNHLADLEQRAHDDYRAVNDDYRAALRGCLLGRLLGPLSLRRKV